MDCFCKDQKSKIGSKASNTIFTGVNGKEAYVCHEWAKDSLIVKVYNFSISLMINVVNTVIKLILVNLI